MYTMNSSSGRSFGPNGCQVPVGRGICGETRTLDIINEFKRLYEEKIKEIDNAGGGDCLQEKLKLQQDWIGDLTEQNEMLVRAVEELEHEATERVNILEEKLQQSAQCICEGERKVQDRDCKIQELQVKLNDVDILTRELQCKKEECDTLQKNMVDIRQALTEEVASKHDTILKLKRECQELEDRCLQADKQIAFKDDIIKELRKEIKQLKQQVTQEEIGKLTRTIDELQGTLQKTKQLQEDEENRNIAKISILSNTIEVVENKLKEAQEKSKICKICRGRSRVGFADSTEVQTDLIDTKQLEQNFPLDLIEQRDNIIKSQNDTLNMMQQELQSLKEIEFGLRCEREEYCQNILCLKNKINESEHIRTEPNPDMEDDMQKLVELVQNRDEIIRNQNETLNLMQKELESLKEAEASMRSEREKYGQNVQQLKNRINELEVTLQNADGRADNLQMAEENRQYKNNFKKMRKQKKCYEEVIIYFKHEMGLMSEQLQNLQELLTLSNDSAHEESSKLMEAFMNVQSLNQQLSTQLSAAEQTVLLENQMNQLHEAKISELERLVSEKEIDLGRHDQAISNIRQTLQCSLKQNEDLHATIVSLNETIMKLQHAIKKYETDNGKSREITENCQAQINSCKEKLAELKEALEKKTAELCKLEMAYNNQNQTLKYAQMELNEMKEKQKSKQCHLKCIIEEMKDKLSKCEEKYQYSKDEMQQLKTQLGIVTRRDAVKDVEIKRYRKIIGDLKKTLIDLNKNLSKRNIQYESKCNNAECRKYMEHAGEERDQDICLNCPCEVDFYQSIVETLKKSVIELKKKLNETQKKNQELEEERKHTESRLAQISQCQMERDREYNELKQKLMEKLKQAQIEESRYLTQANQFERELGSLRQELELKTLQLDECKKSAQEINGSRCVQLACAQEEVSTLKEDLNKLLRKHCALNVENERLHSQSVRMQSTVSGLEETSQLLKEQVEQYLSELQMVQNEKDTLIQKNRDLLCELRSLQSSYSSANKQQRDLRCQCIQEVQRQCPRNIPCPKTASPPPTCQSPWSLGSQGTASLHDDSPSRSPYPNECDWYSSTFRNESEEEEEEEDWVSKVEDLAAQVRRTNKMWKNKMGNSEYTVSKDIKK